MPFWDPPDRLLAPGAYLHTSKLAAALCPNQGHADSLMGNWPNLQPDYSHYAGHSLAANQARNQESAYQTAHSTLPTTTEGVTWSLEGAP